MNSKLILVVLSFIGLVATQSSLSSTDLVNQLPPELQGQVNATEVENVKQKASELFREKCEKNAPGQFESIMKSVKDLPDCVKKGLELPETEVLTAQIQDASKTGSLDEVFKVYCKKTPEAKTCLNGTLHDLNPCFTADEQKNNNIVYNIVDKLIDFICFKEGDRIALFIAEGGPECFQNKTEEIQNCVKEISGSDYQFDTNNITGNPIPQLQFGEKECKSLNDLEHCVVKVLHSCRTPTPANIAESLFKFGRQSTPCADKETAAASGLAIMSTTLIMAVTTTFLF